MGRSFFCVERAGRLNNLVGFVVPAMNFLPLMAVGLDLTPLDFTRVRHQSARVAVGLLGPLVLLPPLALGLTMLFQTRPDVAAGLLLIAVCPVGGISNAFTYLARASPALSITLTGFSCLCAGVTIPLVGVSFELLLGRPLGFHAPATVLAAQTLLLLALPVAIGMGIRRRLPQIAVRYGRSLQRLAFCGVAVILLLIIADEPDAFLRGLSSTVPLALAFVVSATLVGWLSASWVTHDARDRFTIAVEFGTRNVTVAIAIAVTLLGHVEFARFAATYFLVELPMMLIAVSLFRAFQLRKTSRLAAAGPQVE